MRSNSISRRPQQSGCTHTKASLVAIVHLAVVGLIALYRTLSIGQVFSGVVEASLLLITAVASIVLLIGLKMENRLLVSAHICFQSAACCFLFLLFLLLILGYRSPVFTPMADSGAMTTEKELWIVLQIFITIAVIIIETWFLTIVWKSYRYLDDKYDFAGMNRIANV